MLPLEEVQTPLGSLALALCGQRSAYPAKEVDTVVNKERPRQKHVSSIESRKKSKQATSFFENPAKKQTSFYLERLDYVAQVVVRLESIVLCCEGHIPSLVVGKLGANWTRALMALEQSLKS